MKLTSRKRAVQLALEQFHALEHTWEDERARRRRLRELKSFLAALADRPDLRLEHLAALARHIEPGISLPHLCGILVPVEREHERANITDVDFLVSAEDATSEPAPRMPVTVILDNLRSAFNVGGIFRTGECVGVRSLVLCGYTATPANPKVSRSALGTEKIVAWEEAAKADRAVERLREAGCHTVALETAQNAAAPHECAFDFPCAVVLGNERFGLSARLLAACDRVVRIPVYGRKNSLNVVSAFAVVAYELRRQWQQFSVWRHHVLKTG